MHQNKYLWSKGLTDSVKSDLDQRRHHDLKSLVLSELKAFADDRINVTKNKFVFHREENIVEKVENAGYQHCLLFPQCFQTALTSTASKVVIV